MAERKHQIIRDQTLFQTATIAPTYPLVTTLTLGLLKLYRLDMEPDKVYLVDAGYNDIFVYDQVSARHRSKLFWKLNLEGAPELKAEWALRSLDIAVDLPEIPSFDPEFGERGAWVTMDYHIRVQVEMSRQSAGQVRHATNPLTTVQNAALRAARQVLPCTPYQEALVATAEEVIQQRVTNDPKVQTTGLRVVLVDVEGIEGSKKLSESLQQSFGRVLQARDRREIALQFATLDREVFQRLIESEEPKAALEFRARAADQMMQALLASGLNPIQVHQVIGGVAHDIGQPDSLAGQVAAKAFKQIKGEDWPPLQIPQRVSHDERLKWERQQLRERLPAQLQDADDVSDTFTFLLETDHRLEIVWQAPEFPPRIYINGEERRAEYVALAPGIYDYHKTTVWDLYMETRRLLGV